MLDRNPDEKTHSIDSLVKALRPLRDRGKSIVLTNGCFDLLHVGHVRFLRESSKFGDILVVGINSDNSVRSLKGNGRPIITLRERMELLSAIECVDFVTSFDDLIPLNLVRNVRPDIHVKGNEYAPGNGKTMPEAELVQSLGGEVRFVQMIPDRSTTRLIEHMSSVAPEGAQNSGGWK